MGYGFDDWIYWHLFTITINYNSSHIELLLNYESPEESLEFMKKSPFINARERNEDRLQRFHYSCP
jgi:hypothetical protein